MKLRKAGRFLALLLGLCLLAGCGGRSASLPEPEALAEELLAAAKGPEMSAMPPSYLQEVTGVAPEDYESAVYLLPADDTAPDELILVRCRDGAAAGRVREKLEARLAAKADAAQYYLTEQLPVIRAGKVRADGLTVSLLVSGDMAALLAVYDKYR
jgi:hypothetical protein